MKKLSIAGLAFVLVCTGFYLYACRNNDLRGWWKDSDDGKTYLVIEEADGGSVKTQFALDGRPWPHVVSEPGEIEPGCHDLDKIGFCVRQGTEYHFDYWGP
jgi:hypothetical protein